MADNSGGNIFKKLIQLFRTSRRPLPESGDGLYDEEADAFEAAPLKAGIIKDLQGAKKPIPKDLDELLELVKVAKAGGTNISFSDIERLVKLSCGLSGGDNQVGLVVPIAQLCWNSLHHPPLSYLGHEFEYRTADGSNNNVLYPHLGQAGSAYARSVQPSRLQVAVLPEEGKTFDALLARTEFKPHPNQISSLFYYMSIIISHDLFHTSFKDPGINLASSYLDLSPLYGSSQAEQHRIRTFKDGQLKLDTFADRRLELFPPGVAALMICFNRFHNYVVGQLALINEGGRFKKPADNSTAAAVKYDNDLFQTGRLITCGLYINIIVNDFVSTLVGMPELNTAWLLDPSVGGATESLATQWTPAPGNQVSCEFNLLSQFHMLMSDKDDKWMRGLMQEIAPGLNPETASLEEFEHALGSYFHMHHTDPATRKCGDLTRGSDGTFDNDALLKVLTEATEDCAAAFNSGIPKVYRGFAMLAIKVSRDWRAATLNEYRKFFNLELHKTFDDINPQKTVMLRNLYGHPNNVEFYPGVLLEKSTALPPPAMGRGLLCDAISVIRGDRFYTQDYSPSLLTQWGYTAVTSDPTVAGGFVMHRLLMRAFPGYYAFNSVYAMFPFTVPNKTRETLTKSNTLSTYSFTLPKKPPFSIATLGSMTYISDYHALIRIFNDPDTFKEAWGPAIEELTGAMYMLGWDTPESTDQHKRLHQEIFGPNTASKATWDYFENLTLDLIKRNSYNLGGVMEVDAVKDVGNLAFGHFFGKLFGFPLKTEKSPHGLLTEAEMFEILGAIFAFLFFNADEVWGLKLKTATVAAYKQVSELLKLNIAKVKVGEFINGSKDKPPSGDFVELYGQHLIERMVNDKKNKSTDEIVTQVLLTASGLANLSAEFAQLLDLYLSDEYQSDWEEIVRLSKLDDDDSKQKLTRYVMEGCRLSTIAPQLNRVVAKDAVVNDGGKQVNCKAGDIIFLNLTAANVSPEMFPEPNKVKIDRPLEKYIHFGWGNHRCFGAPWANIGLTAMLRCVARLPNFRRAPGPEGQLKFVRIGLFRVYMTQEWSNFSYWPTSLHLSGVADV